MEADSLGYTVSTESTDVIQNAYYKVRFLHPSASHVICAYILPSDGLFAMDYCDDGEHGAGRTLLKFMQQHEMTCRAIFIVRYFGGKKLGPKRHECITRAAVAVMRRFPINLVTGDKQSPDRPRHKNPSPTSNRNENIPKNQEKRQHGDRGYPKTRPSYSGAIRSKSAQRGMQSRGGRFNYGRGQRGHHGAYRGRRDHGYQSNNYKRKLSSPEYGSKPYKLSPYHPDYNRDIEENNSVYSDNNKESWHQGDGNSYDIDDLR